MNPKCCYCNKEMADIGDSYCCTGTFRNMHYHRTAKEGKGWSVENGDQHFKKFVKGELEKK